MATELVLPLLSRHQQQSRYFLANGSPESPLRTAPSSLSFQQTPRRLQISPLDTASAHESTSLSSHHNHHQQQDGYSSPSSPSALLPAHMQQPDGRPLYMPAVLRRCDEFPSHTVTRCRTAGSTSSSESDLTLRRVDSAIMSIPGLSLLSQRIGRRPATAEPAQSLDGDWKLDTFPQITGLPTRKHWKPDPESSICDDPTCKRTFNYFTRRHHCRKCGNIFCNSHSSASLPLDQDAKFNPRASHPSRTCDFCFSEIKALHSRQGSSPSSSSTSSSELPPSTPVMTAPPPAPGVTPPHKPEIAASVPCNWNWSTF